MVNTYLYVNLISLAKYITLPGAMAAPKRAIRQNPVWAAFNRIFTCAVLASLDESNAAVCEK